MSRPLRLDFPGALLHVTSRGNDQRDTFLDDVDRNSFLEFLGEAVRRFAWILTAYVLMSNHYHLLIQLTESTLSRGMKWLNGEYGRCFNRRPGRVGHLFQGRFKSPLIEKEAYFLEVQRYVVLNPVRAGMVLRPEEYSWSSYRAVLGEATVPDWLAVDDVLLNFGSEREIARARYRRFVENGIGLERTPWADLVGGMYLGREAWVGQMREKVELEPRSDDHPRRERIPVRPPMAAIISSVAECLSIDEMRIRHGRGGVPRMLSAWLGCYEGLLTNREIAASLRVRSSSQVSRLVRQFDGDLSRNDDLQAMVDRCVSTMRRKNAKG
jgi:REP element-mobilizing transposase RayT